MKNQEKRNLFILILVAVIIIAVLVNIRNAKNAQGSEIPENNNSVTGQEVNPEQNQENEQLGEFEQLLEDGTKLNTSEELKKEKEIEGIKITNIQLTEQGGQTVLLADVTNSTEAETDVIGINIIVLDKEGQEIGKIPGAVSPLKPGETKQLNVGITEKYGNAYNFRVEKQQ